MQSTLALSRWLGDFWGTISTSHYRITDNSYRITDNSYRLQLKIYIGLSSIPPSIRLPSIPLFATQISHSPFTYSNKLHTILLYIIPSSVCLFNILLSIRLYNKLPSNSLSPLFAHPVYMPQVI